MSLILAVPIVCGNREYVVLQYKVSLLVQTRVRTI
jgi:hypothetical protein